jgi:hypothetical protein
MNSVAWVREQQYRPSDRRFVVSVTDPYSRILGFLDRSRCDFFFQPDNSVNVYAFGGGGGCVCICCDTSQTDLRSDLTFFKAVIGTHPLANLICIQLRCDSEAYLCNTMSLQMNSSQ